MAQGEAAIENLPHDALKEIMLRVAGQADGATDIAMTLAVSKTFLRFSEDGDVLRAVSFKDLSTRLHDASTRVAFEKMAREDFASPYEKFQKVGGLLVRSAKAGNLDAQFMLAKVIMVSASTLLRARERGLLDPLVQRRKAPRTRRDCKICKAKCFIEHFLIERGENAGARACPRHMIRTREAVPVSSDD